MKYAGKNMLFLQVYEGLWILFPVIKLSREEKKKNLCSSVVWWWLPSPLNANDSYPYSQGYFCYLVPGLPVFFFNLSAHGCLQQREERARSVSISPCISWKQRAGSTCWRQAGALGLRAGQLGLLCSHTVVCFPSLSSRECATKCFLSHTSWSCCRHVPYVLQSLLLLGKIHALMFPASKRWFLLQKLYCSSITRFNLLFMDLWNHFWRKLIFLCVHRWIASRWKCAASVCCLPGYRC